MNNELIDKILVLGDTHGEGEWVRKAAEEAVAHGCDVILQLGDFGFWEHSPDGVAFLDLVAEILDTFNLQLVWIDGNHENHVLLRSRYVVPDKRDGDLYRIRPRLYYAPRGARWTWAGVRFLACGGAYSVDKERRRVGRSWWWEETITDDEVDACVSGGKCDVLVSHDAPVGARSIMGPTTVGDKNMFPASMANRAQLRRVVDACRPVVNLHGHYHHRNSESFELEDGWTVYVEGFGRDWDPESIGALHLPGVKALADVARL